MSDPLTLPKSLAAYGTPAFNETLAHELLDNLWKLPLDKLCQKGGWPYKDGPFSLYEIEVVDGDAGHSEQRAKNLFPGGGPDTIVAGALHITCGVSFEEAVPSCCAGGGITDNHMGTLTLTIDKTTALSTATVTEM